MLNQIVEQKKLELNALELPEQNHVQHVSLKKALLHSHRRLGLIAEVKKASPSKGVFVENFKPVTIAKSYESAQADAISCLTDDVFFQGHREYLMSIKREVNLPVLRKDFIIDPIQIEETKRMGADAVLLIASILETRKLHELYMQAIENDIECLVEVHTENELESILSVFTPEILGINNRRLQTFDTSLDVTEHMMSFIPDHTLIVSESGIRTKHDIDRLIQLNVNAVLVGETLMRAINPEHGIKKLFGDGK